MTRLFAALEAVVEGFGALARWCVLALVLLVAFNVLLRYFADVSPVWLQELEWHLISPIALFGVAYALKHDAHVRVDFLYERFPAAAKRVVDSVGGVLLTVLSVILLLLSLPYVEQSHMLGEGSPDPGGLPHRFLLKAILPLGFAVLALQGLVVSLRPWFGARAGEAA